MQQNNIILPAEWEPQRAIMLTWPHEGTDWAYMLSDITATYVEMAREIADHEQLIIVAPHTDEVRTLLEQTLPAASMERITFHACPTNDTWARDHGFITLRKRDAESPLLMDFCFNGWGEKFAADKDNAINRSLYAAGVVEGTYENHLDFVLEGGSIESDGQGTVFTTSQCLLAPHRNQPLTQKQIEEQLKELLGADRIVWLDHGNLIGDDTDGHIDTIVRPVSTDTLLYIKSVNPDDEQHADFQALENQLRLLRTSQGKPYRLVPLPMPEVIFDEDGERLPATYANFLITNEKVLVPTYAQPTNDQMALQTIAEVFPNRTIVGIDSRSIIRQHGSIHCCTMQFPEIKEQQY